MFVNIFKKWVSKVLSCRIFSYGCFHLLRYPEKTADISRQHHRVSRNLVPRAFPLIFKGKALGTRLGFPRNKACDGVAKCRLFSVSSASNLPASPYEHVFLVKENLQKHNRFASYAVSV